MEVVSDDTYRRTIALGAARGTIRVGHEPSRHRLIAELLIADGAVALAPIEARLARMFDLDADPAAIGAALAREPRLAMLVAARPGLRVPGCWDDFELAVRAIIGQQISVTAATGMLGRLAASFGAPLPPGVAATGLNRLFPAPSELAAAAISGMPRARAAALIALARAIAAEPALLLRGANLDTSIARLTVLPGIGPWTAHYIAMRAMREPDAFPAGDIGLLRALDDGAGRPSHAALAARAEAWRPYRAYATIHLWTARPA